MPPPLMTCPRCGFAQPPAEDCARCGVVVWKAAERPLAAPAPAPPAPASKGGGGLVVLMLFLFAAAGGLLFFAHAREEARAAEEREAQARPARRRVDPGSALPEPGAFASRQEPRAPWGPPPEEPSPSNTVPAAAAAPVTEAPISSWYHGADGYRRAEEDRKRYGTAMAVYFHTDWCGWCRKMENEILSASESSAYLDRLPKVKIDPEKGQEEAAIAREFGVRGYPAFFIVPASGGGGRRVHPFKKSGNLSPAEFVAACRSSE